MRKKLFAPSCLCAFVAMCHRASVANWHFLTIFRKITGEKISTTFIGFTRRPVTLGKLAGFSFYTFDFCSFRAFSLDGTYCHQPADFSFLYLFNADGLERLYYVVDVQLHLSGWRGSHPGK